MSKPITPQQLKKISTIISKAGISKEAKVAMVQGFTYNRETSTTKMYFDEASFMIKHLETLNPQKQGIAKMKGKMLYYAREMGWVKTGQGGKLVADVLQVDKWCLTYGTIKRKLDGYTYNELTVILTQFEKVYKSFLNSI